MELKEEFMNIYTISSIMPKISAIIKSKPADAKDPNNTDTPAPILNPLLTKLALL